MYLYHYYDKRSGPFKSLTALPKKDAFTVLEKIKQDRPSWRRIFVGVGKEYSCDQVL